MSDDVIACSEEEDYDKDLLLCVIKHALCIYGVLRKLSSIEIVLCHTCHSFHKISW